MPADVVDYQHTGCCHAAAVPDQEQSQVQTEQHEAARPELAEGVADVMHHEEETAGLCWQQLQAATWACAGQRQSAAAESPSAAVAGHASAGAAAVVA